MTGQEKTLELLTIAREGEPKKDKDAREKSLKVTRKKVASIQAELADSKNPKPYKMAWAMHTHRAGDPYVFVYDGEGISRQCVLMSNQDSRTGDFHQMLSQLGTARRYTRFNS